MVHLIKSSDILVLVYLYKMPNNTISSQFFTRRSCGLCFRFVDLGWAGERLQLLLWNKYWIYHCICCLYLFFMGPCWLLEYLITVFAVNIKIFTFDCGLFTELEASGAASLCIIFSGAGKAHVCTFLNFCSWFWPLLCPFLQELCWKIMGSHKRYWVPTTKFLGSHHKILGSHQEIIGSQFPPKISFLFFPHHIPSKAL